MEHTQLQLTCPSAGVPEVIMGRASGTVVGRQQWLHERASSPVSSLIPGREGGEGWGVGRLHERRGDLGYATCPLTAHKPIY